MKLLLSLLLLIPGAVMAQSGTPVDALKLEQQHQPAAAEEIWRGILEKSPRNAEALAHMGLDEALQQRYDTAISYYRKAVAINPELPSLRLNLGLALFKTSRFKEAAPEFAAELRKHPGDLRLTILTGMAHYGAGEYTEAIPYLKKATAADTQSLPLRLALAHSCMWTHQSPCVMSVYKEILALNAESAEADMLAGEALDEMGDNAGALQQFRAAERANPKEPDVHFGIGYLLWTQKQYQEAANEFRAELANDPNHGQARAYLGDTLLQLNDSAGALKELEEALPKAPGMALVHLDLGILYAQADRNDDAVEQLRKAAELDPKDPNPHWRLAKLYQSMGKKAEAQAEFKLVSTMKHAQNEALYKQIANAHAPAQTK